MTVTLVTGGAGSLGRVLVQRLVERGDQVRVLDNHEASLAALTTPGIRKLYGTVTSPDRVRFAMRGVQTVYHLAAMKNLTIAEYNAEDLVQTNVDGTLNVARAAIDAGVERAIFISSDKAVHPTSAYGATKTMGEFLWKWAGRIQNETRFAILRSGNFKVSSGSVFDIWADQHERRVPLTLTDERMIRYFIDMERVVDILLDIEAKMDAPLVCVPKVCIPRMEKVYIGAMLRDLYPTDPITVTGLRAGERLCEELVTDSEHSSYDTGLYEVVW